MMNTRLTASSHTNSHMCMHKYTGLPSNLSFSSFKSFPFLIAPTKCCFIFILRLFLWHSSPILVLPIHILQPLPYILTNVNLVQVKIVSLQHSYRPNCTKIISIVRDFSYWQFIYFLILAIPTEYIYDKASVVVESTSTSITFFKSNGSR